MVHKGSIFLSNVTNYFNYLGNGILNFILLRQKYGGKKLREKRIPSDKNDDCFELKCHILFNNQRRK